MGCDEDGETMVGLRWEWAPRCAHLSVYHIGNRLLNSLKQRLPICAENVMTETETNGSSNEGMHGARSKWD